MKTYTALLFASAAFATSAQGANLVTDFSGYNTGADVAGQYGWTINDSTADLSYFALLNGSNAACLGGNYNAPVLPTVSLQHDASAIFGQTTITFDYTIVDSTNAYPDRDTFGVEVTGATNNNLFSVVLVPDAQSATPSSTTEKMDIYYSTGAGPLVPTGIATTEGNLYNLGISFTPSGATTNFTLSVGNSGGSSTFSGNVAVDPTTLTNNFAVNWSTYDQVNPNNAGNNYIALTNLVDVPEPSSVLLCGLGGLGSFVLLRRRA